MVSWRMKRSRWHRMEDVGYAFEKAHPQLLTISLRYMCLGESATPSELRMDFQMRLPCLWHGVVDNHFKL
jgi:hypothetical protein